MTDNVATATDAAPQSAAADQARLRRERREAKLKAGGSARLNKISGLDGRVVGDHGDAPEPAETAPKKSAEPSSTQHGDPEEIDISEHFYEPKTTAARRQQQPLATADPAMSEGQLRQMMLGMDRPQAMAGAPDEDPIMKMMSQLMSGGGQGFPPGAGEGPSLSSSPFPGFPAAPQAQTVRPDPATSLWRLLHALVALGLGLYVAVLTPLFAGTWAEREREALAASGSGSGGDPLAAADANERHKQVFFWVFATAEAGLLTARLFLDKGRAPPAGMAWTVVGFLPGQLGEYAKVLLRYGQIFSTVRTDMLVCMFVLGVCSWLRKA